MTNTEKEIVKNIEPSVKEPTLQMHKSITPMVCPHCSKNIMVAIKTFIPTVDWVLRTEDLENAKIRVRDAVTKSTTLSENEKADIFKWLENEDFVFGPGEVDMIIDRVLNDK